MCGLAHFWRLCSCWCWGNMYWRHVDEFIDWLNWYFVYESVVYQLWARWLVKWTPVEIVTLDVKELRN